MALKLQHGLKVLHIKGVDYVDGMALTKELKANKEFMEAFEHAKNIGLILDDKQKKEE